MSAGIEGHGTKYNFGGNEGNDFLTIHSSSYIDFCTAHPYPTADWANKSITETEITIKQWIYDCQFILNKPMVIEEFNVHESDGITSPTRVEWWSAIYKIIYDENGKFICLYII